MEGDFLLRRRLPLPHTTDDSICGARHAGQGGPCGSDSKRWILEVCLSIHPNSRRRQLADTCGRYWFGTPDAEGRNLATCIWRSQEDARKGGIGPAHRKAAGAARSLYDFWKIDRLKLTIEDDLKSWAITAWDM